MKGKGGWQEGDGATFYWDSTGGMKGIQEVGKGKGNDGNEVARRRRKVLSGLNGGKT